MKNRAINTNILSMRIISNADAALLEQFDVRKQDRSLGIFTTDCDDVSYVALDEATKAADVHVVYAKSMYAGASNASTALAGEFIGIFSGPDPETVRSGLEAVRSFIQQKAHFYTANEKETVVYFSHCISRTGRYLSKLAGVQEGVAMAYLIAPPLEATVGLDEALKAAQVELKVYYGPPTETNFSGGLLVGEQAACKAACEAFAQTVINVADNPLGY